MCFKKRLLIIAALASLFFISACDEPEQPPASSAVGGSLLVLGREITEEHEVLNQDVRFGAGEEFYFYFHNNMPFDTEEVEVRLINNSNDEILAENSYEVHPDAKTVTDKIWFGSPGRFSILVQVGDQVRAVREVIIE